MEQAPTIISVVDTRDYMELDDRWVAIPGSGITLECERCGRGHEVHVTVEYADGHTAVVGTGCAERGEQYGRKLAAGAGTVARNAAKVRRLEAHLEVTTHARNVAAGMELETLRTEAGLTDRSTWLISGPARVLARVGDDMAERERALVSSYRERYAEVMVALAGYRPMPAYWVSDQLEQARRQLRLAEAKLAATA